MFNPILGFSGGLLLEATVAMTTVSWSATACLSKGFAGSDEDSKEELSNGRCGNCWTDNN